LTQPTTESVREARVTALAAGASRYFGLYRS
jgi:hypothetical protein